MSNYPDDFSQSAYDAIYGESKPWMDEPENKGAVWCSEAQRLKAIKEFEAYFAKQAREVRS